jgi:hypothetical protein
MLIGKMDANGIKYTIGENLQYELESFRERMGFKKEEENNNN